MTKFIISLMLMISFSVQAKQLSRNCKREISKIAQNHDRWDRMYDNGDLSRSEVNYLKKRSDKMVQIVANSCGADESDAFDYFDQKLGQGIER